MFDKQNKKNDVQLQMLSSFRRRPISLDNKKQNKWREIDKPKKLNNNKMWPLLRFSTILEQQNEKAVFRHLNPLCLYFEHTKQEKERLKIERKRS